MLYTVYFTSLFIYLLYFCYSTDIFLINMLINNYIFIHVKLHNLIIKNNVYIYYIILTFFLFV